MSSFDLNALIERGLGWKEPDPHVIANRLVQFIPAEKRAAVLAVLLVHKVREANRFCRAKSHVAKAGPEAPRAAGRSKWTRHAPRLRYLGVDGWKFFEEMSAEDCEYQAKAYTQSANFHIAQAERFRQLAERIRAAGVATVADLDVDDGLELAA